MFIDRSDLLPDKHPQKNYGIAVADIDGDGQIEAFVTGFGFPNVVLKWNGTQFKNIADPVLADLDRQSIGVAAADIDGDGHEEIYVLNTDTFGGPKRIADRLFDFGGDKWVDLFSLRYNEPVLNLTAGRSVICVDRFGRGTYGFYVANYGGPARLYELDLDGNLLEVAQAAGVNKVTGGRGAVSLPLVTPNMDIFAVNEQGGNFLFRNNGDGTFTDVAQTFKVMDEEENARGVAVLDADGDGRLDIVYGNWEGPHRLYVRTGNSHFEDRAPQIMRQPTRVRTVIAADFDNDGYEEVFFNNIGQPNRLFAWRDGMWQLIDAGPASEPSGLGTGAAVADFNGDGSLELLIAHGESGMQPLSYYQALPNDNHYLRVQPLTPYGAPARGAVVHIKMGERVQVRAIDAGSGYLCQMEPVAHFGLGQSTDVEEVSVQWPDGATTRIDTPAIDQLLTVNYPTT